MLKVLIIEDNSQLRHYIAGYLLSYEDRFEVLTADPGKMGTTISGTGFGNKEGIDKNQW